MLLGMPHSLLISGKVVQIFIYLSKSTTQDVICNAKLE
jgi:hypothetical protein